MNGPPRSTVLLMRLLGGGMLLLTGLTWPLWTGTSALPQIPWSSLLISVPIGFDRGLLAAVLCFAVVACVRPERLIVRRGWCGVGTIAWGLLLLLDQLRVQPWAWEFFLILLLWGVCRVEEVPSGWRAVVIGIYFWSAVSKIDRGFVDGHGQLLLEGLLKSLGSSAEFWPASRRQLAALMMPAGELAVAVLLTAQRTRLWGWLGSLAMHSLLLLTLGPWGLGHEPGVLAWNLFFILQNTLLFFPRQRSTVAALRLKLPARSVVTLTLAVPALELVGWYDHWPAWAVYCARPELVRVAVREEAVHRLPASVQAHVLVPQPLDELQPVSLEGWVFRQARAPIYPQGRYRMALAAAVLQSVADGSFRVELASSPDRWTGRRGVEIATSRSEIDAVMRRYAVNTRPRRRLPDKGAP